MELDARSNANSTSHKARHEPRTIEEKAVSATHMLHGLALSAIISGYIFGPLLILGGIPWFLYKQGIVSKWVVAVCIILAFVASNTLIITRAKKLITGFNHKTGIKDPTPEQAAKWRATRRYNPEDDDF